MRRTDLWLLVIAGGLLFPLAIALQVPLQKLYARWVVVPGAQRGFSILVLGIGTVALSGLVQEMFKFLPILACSRRVSSGENRAAAVALGAGVGVGFGLVEAVLLTDRTLALGIVSPWGIFERAFAILFHAAVAAILALGVWKGARLGYFFLAALLHALGNFSVILYRQNSLNPTLVEISVALFDFSILAFVLWSSRPELPGPATNPEEVVHA
jgi:hypothetical protein